MLYYITGNKRKAEVAQNNLKSFNIELTIHPLELVEIQSESIEEIARDKAQQAFKIIKKPLIVTDHGWFIPALNGFPGPYMKYVNQWFTSEDFLNLTKNLKDRTIVLSDVLCYIDRTSMKIFKSEFTGKLLTEIKGEGLPTMKLVTMTDDQKSVAQYISEGKDPFIHNTNWKKLAQFYRTK